MCNQYYNLLATNIISTENEDDHHHCSNERYPVSASLQPSSSRANFPAIQETGKYAPLHVALRFANELVHVNRPVLFFMSPEDNKEYKQTHKDTHTQTHTRTHTNIYTHTLARTN